MQKMQKNSKNIKKNIEFKKYKQWIKENRQKVKGKKTEKAKFSKINGKQAEVELEFMQMLKSKLKLKIQLNYLSTWMGGWSDRTKLIPNSIKVKFEVKVCVELGKMQNV